VVTDSAVKAKLREAGYNQPQFSESTHVLVFSARTDAGRRVDEYIAATKGDPEGPHAKFLRSSIGGLDKDTALAWATKHAGIALGFALAAATEEKIPSCPMDGFDPAKFAAILGLPPSHVPVAALALGRPADEGQKATPFPRFRFPEEDVVKMM
jgi:nitroreductase/dihydropteridine reductase